MDLTHDDTKTPSPILQLSSPSAPSKTPSTKDSSSSSIDYIPKSPTSSTSLSPNGSIMPEGDIDNLTMEQYLALTPGNQAWGVVKPKIRGNVNFEIKSQFMRELREDTFSGNKNDDAHEHVERLKGGWTDYPQEPLTPGISLKKSLSKGLGKGLIPGMTPAQALTAIQTMTGHSQKWHDYSSSRNMDSNSNTEGIAAIVSKLDSLGRDMKKLKENVHAIQLGFQTCRGAHLNKECPLNEEVKSMEEVKYGEFRCHPPFSGGNGAKYHERSGKKARMVKIDTPSAYFYKLVKQDCNGTLKNGVVKILLPSPKGPFLQGMGELGPTKDPQAKSFDDYKRVFDLEIDQLTDEYEFRIGKKGHMARNIGSSSRKTQGITQTMHDHGFEEDKRETV
ncbi:hypothetical protein Tco_0755790 [Tanacetum coccineum]